MLCRVLSDCRRPRAAASLGRPPLRKLLVQVGSRLGLLLCAPGVRGACMPSSELARYCQISAWLHGGRAASEWEQLSHLERLQQCVQVHMTHLLPAAGAAAQSRLQEQLAQPGAFQLAILCWQRRAAAAGPCLLALLMLPWPPAQQAPCWLPQAAGREPRHAAPAVSRSAGRPVRAGSSLAPAAGLCCALAAAAALAWSLHHRPWPGHAPAHHACKGSHVRQLLRPAGAAWPD